MAKYSTVQLSRQIFMGQSTKYVFCAKDVNIAYYKKVHIFLVDE